MRYKDRISYYDMDERTAQMYKPIDKYLRQSARFSKGSMLGRKILGIIGYILLILFIIALTVACCSAKGKIVVKGFFILVFTVPFLCGSVLALKEHIQKFGTVLAPDLLTCENILDEDGVAEVYKDYISAEWFNDRTKIGSKYIFMYGKTLVRLKDIVGTDLVTRVHHGDENTFYTYHFSIYVNDEMGSRVYDLETLSSNENKRMQRFAELCRLTENKQKRIDMVDI